MNEHQQCKSSKFKITSFLNPLSQQHKSSQSPGQVSHSITIISNPNIAPAVVDGTPKLVPAPLELEAAGLEFFVLAAIGELVPMRRGKPLLKQSGEQSSKSREVMLLTTRFVIVAPAC